MNGLAKTSLLAMLLAGSVAPAARAEEGKVFRAGAGEKDITPPAGVPMWGYGARHDMLFPGSRSTR